MACLLLGCQPAPVTTPVTVVPEPIAKPSPVEPVKPVEPPPSKAIEEPEPLIHSELGWVRDADDPAAPLVQLQDAKSFGAGGDALVEAIVGTADSLLSCWETRNESVDGRVNVRVDLRAPSDPADDPLNVSAANQTAASVVQCADEALRKVVPRPGEGAGAVVLFTMFPRRDEAQLRRANPDELVAVRVAGTCWQWEDYPCKPHKHCKADEWVRTTCGEPTQRDDVALHYGLGTPKDGYADAVDVRLVQGDGTVLWLQPLAFELGRAFQAAPSVAIDTTAFGVHMGHESLVVADAQGVRTYDRTTGATSMTWSVEPGDPRMWFDKGEFVLSRGNKELCRGEAGHGSFFADCGELRVYFDGHTAALLEGDPPRVVVQAALGERGAKLESSVMPRAEFRLGKYRLKIDGIIYLE